MSGPVPTFKVESLPDQHVKMEPMEDTPSPDVMSDGYADDGEIDDPELDFKQARQDLWLTKVPKYLWDVFSKLGDNDEIEIGTIRVEGPFDHPERVSMMLNTKLPGLQAQPREYNVSAVPSTMRKSKRTGQVMVFSEKDKPGYKAKTFAWDDIDEDGNPGQGRSFLYEQQKKDEKKKENKGRYVPYTRRPIPKLTSMAGTVTQEYETFPVENDEYRRFQSRQAGNMLRSKHKQAADLVLVDPSKHYATITTSSERREINKQAQIRKQAAKDNRAARIDKSELMDALFQRFREHRFWGLRDLRASLKQPEQWIKENLDEIAVMHRAGDFNGKWELKDEYKHGDASLMNSTGAAPKMEDSDAEMKSDDDMDFEDVRAP